MPVDTSRARAQHPLLLPELGVSWLELPERLGVGTAMRIGLRYALRRGYGFAVRVDGDGQHPASEIDRLLGANKIINANTQIMVVVNGNALNLAGDLASRFLKMRLDTFPPKMGKAVKLYESHGFREIPPYHDNPHTGVLFMELDL